MTQTQNDASNILIMSTSSAALELPELCRKQGLSMTSQHILSTRMQAERISTHAATSTTGRGPTESWAGCELPWAQRRARLHELQSTHQHLSLTLPMACLLRRLHARLEERLFAADALHMQPTSVSRRRARLDAFREVRVGLVPLPHLPCPREAGRPDPCLSSPCRPTKHLPPSAALQALAGYARLSGPHGRVMAQVASAYDAVLADWVSSALDNIHLRQLLASHEAAQVRVRACG